MRIVPNIVTERADYRAKHPTISVKACETQAQNLVARLLKYYHNLTVRARGEQVKGRAF